MRARFVLCLSVLLQASSVFAQVDASTDASSADAMVGDAGGPVWNGMELLGPCPPGAVGCARAPMSFSRRIGIPVEFDYDTNWVPSGSPVQVRFRAALVGHTNVRLAGALEGAWPNPIYLRAHGRPGGGSIETDWGVVIDARIRLNLQTDVGSRSWEGAIPYVPMVDFRARSSQIFDPWAWEPVSITGSTARQHLADVSLTDAIVRIPGISGGLSFDLSAEVGARYRSVQLFFGTDADPITARQNAVLGLFRGGPFVEYNVRLDGWLEQTVALVVYPSLYVSLAGRRWMLDLARIPINLGPFGGDFRFDPQRVRLDLPDIQRREVIVDFGSVLVGTTREDSVPVNSGAGTELSVQAPTDEGPFAFPRRDALLAPRSSTFFPVVFTPTTPGPIEQRVVFRTNDPDTPEYAVVLRGEGIVRSGPEPTLTDAGVMPMRSDASTDAGTGVQMGGCGCRTTPVSRGNSAVGMLLLGLLLRRRSRRTEHRSGA